MNADYGYYVITSAAERVRRASVRPSDETSQMGARFAHGSRAHSKPAPFRLFSQAQLISANVDFNYNANTPRASERRQERESSAHARLGARRDMTLGPIVSVASVAQTCPSDGSGRPSYNVQYLQQKRTSSPLAGPLVGSDRLNRAPRVLKVRNALACAPTMSNGSQKDERAVVK